MNFSENLRTLREKSGMTQEQLAEKMEVSRQTVSKWESAGSYPEMDKMLALTELFGCTMDTLLKGSVEKSTREVAERYEAHGNWMAKTIASGVGLCILGAAAECASEFFMESTGMFFLLFALVAVTFFVRGGMESTHFRKKYPYVEPFYTEEMLETFHRKFVTVITGGVAAIIASVVLYIALVQQPFFAEGTKGELLGESLFLTAIAAAVTTIVYIGLQASKYNVDSYNRDNAWENSEEGKENGRRIGMACGALMTAVTAAYVGLSAATGGWHRFWWLFAVGGICCGVIAIVLNKRKD